MNKQEINLKNKIKRKKFLIYSGVSAAALIAFIKNPFRKVIEKNFGNELTGSVNLKTRSNPFAVKRTQKINNG